MPELARLILAQICIHASMAGLRMAAVLLALKQGASPLQVGVLMAFFSLSPVFLALPAGRFADQHGLKRPVGFSVVAACLGAGLAALFPFYGALCLAALLTGGALGAASIALQRHVGRAAASARQLRRDFSWLAVGPAVSSFIGPLSAGLLIDHAGSFPGAGPGAVSGFQAAFVAMALLPLLSWVLIRRTAELRAPAVAARGSSSAWHLLKDKKLRRLLLVNWLLSSCWDVHAFMVPVLGFEKNFSASTIGAIIGAFALAAASVRLALPAFAEQLREHVVITLAMLGAALLLVVYPFLGSAMAMGTGSLLLGLVLGTVQPMVMSLLHQITPDGRHGQALALRQMVLNSSSVAMPVLFGTLGTVVGITAVFWTIACALTLTAWSARSLGQFLGVLTAHEGAATADKTPE